MKNIRVKTSTEVNLRTRLDFSYYVTALLALKYYKDFAKNLSPDFSKRSVALLKELKEAQSQDQKEVPKEILKTHGLDKEFSKILQLKSQGHIIIVFSAMCLEALINDFCILNSSKGMLEKVDKLSPVNKWTVIPKLVSNVDFRTDTNAYRLIEKLFALRNTMVHAKSKEYNNIKNLPGVQYEELKDSLLTVQEATKELNSLVPEYKNLEVYKRFWEKNIEAINEFDLFWYSTYGEMHLNGYN